MRICSHCKKEKPFTDFYKDKSNKSGVLYICKKCNKEYQLNLKEKYPWKRFLRSIKNRCNNKNAYKYNRYGGRGIKCQITLEEVKELWFRDKAYEMKRPSIDKIDNDSHYSIDNCRFLELSKNAENGNIKKVLQYELNGVFVKEWDGIKIAGKELHIAETNISSCCVGKRASAGGYIWKHK
jgi:hypothetical protein